MKAIPLTKGKVAIVDEADYEMLSKFKWLVCGNYAARRSKKKTEGLPQRAIYMHRVIMRAQEGDLVDHINADKLDNRRENLRFCTSQQNSANMRVFRTNKLRTKGVSIKKGYPNKPFRAAFRKKGVVLLDKNFATLEEAKTAYSTLHRQHHGEFSHS